MKKGLRQADIKQGQPILNRLQSKSTEDEPNAAGSEPSLRKIVRIVFNLGIHRRANAGDKAGQCRGNVAHGPDDRSPKLATSNAWTARGAVVERGPYATRIREYLADGDDSAKCDCVFEA